MEETRSGEPFVGPRSIKTGELLFGRDYEVRTLTNLLIPKRIVLLHAPSGAGKSSLINAGLLPALREEGFRIMPVIRVNQEPTAPTTIQATRPANRFIASILSSLEPQTQRLAIHEIAALAQQPLAKYAEHRLDLTDRRPTVLIFDQFEEILTVDPIDLSSKQECFTWLGKGLVDRRLWALFVIREDFLGALEPYLPAIPTQLSVRMRLDLLGIEAANEAIRRPRPEDGRKVPENAVFETFTEEASKQLIDDLRQVHLQQPDGAFLPHPGPYVEPMLLQIVCKRLWDKWSKSTNQIDVTMLDKNKDVGTVNEALTHYYIFVISSVAADSTIGVTERAIRDWFDRQLIDSQGIRGQIMKGKDRSQGLDNRAIQRLIDSHLVRAEERRGATWFELAHDRLIEPIRSDNVQWRETHLHDVQRKAAHWNNQGRPVNLLLRDEQLLKAEGWRKTITTNLEAFEEDFLLESRIAQDRSEKAQAREAEMRSNLADTGWGVIFARNADPAVREALRELLDHRRSQATQRREGYYKEFAGEIGGYCKDETADDWLTRQGARIAQPEPQRVPYHLLIVGEPEIIPFEFQYKLGMHYSVGRIAFDRLEDYASYARSVVTAEGNAANIPKSTIVFAPKNDDDIVTEKAQPIIQSSVETLTLEHPDWFPSGILGDAANKAALRRVLGGPATPSILWISANGASFVNKRQDQILYQGAIVCADWPGPSATSPLTGDMYFSVDDLSDAARLLGLVLFLNSSYGAGTPRFDDNPDIFHYGNQTRKEIAPYAFIAALPKRLLSHPKGGALAVIGHVERIWVTKYSEVSNDAALRIVKRLMQGYSVGASLEIYNQLHAYFSNKLSDDFLESNLYNKKLSSETLFFARETISLRNWIIFGDPAVCLAGRGHSSATEERLTIEPPEATPTITPEPLITKALPSTDVQSSGSTMAEAGIRNQTSSPQMLIFNGINGETGSYSRTPMTPADLMSVILGETSARHLKELSSIAKRRSDSF